MTKPFTVVDVASRGEDHDRIWEYMQARLHNFIIKAGLDPSNFGYTQYINRAPKHLMDSFLSTFYSHLVCDILLLVAERA